MWRIRPVQLYRNLCTGLSLTLLAACGGGSVSDPPGSTPPLTNEPKNTAPVALFTSSGVTGFVPLPPGF